MAINVYKFKVQALQGKLFRAAKQSLDRKFGALYDKIYREDVLWTSWAKVRSNEGAPGIDEQDFEYIEGEIGVGAFLAELQSELRSEKYRATAVRRCWIEKPGKPEKRPLGIPVIKDRVCQMACKLVIEPIFETNFLPCSNGFRPKRSAHKAIRQIKSAVTYAKQTEVIDADIRGFFDNLSQKILLNLVGRRINDRRVIRLIQCWLEAGVMDGGELTKPDGVGTPQGGVISPLLSNIYLHSFDTMFKESGIKGTLVRYADDFVILLWNKGEEVLEKVRQMLGRLRLTMHPDKTRVVNAMEGFDFLGMHFRLGKVRKWGSKLKHNCRVWPSESSYERIKQKIRDKIGRRYSLSLEELIKELNPVLRGWSNYHTAVSPERKRLIKLNAFTYERLRIFLKRKYTDRTRGYKRVSGNLPVRLGLFQFG
jgi:group II intron reverse transcriptase/maturase